MARPLKDGVDYFPKDTSFFRDKKIILLKSECGFAGVTAFDYLLCQIYEQEGYYMEWDKSACYMTANGLGNGITHKNVNDIVECCVKYGLFDEEIFREYGILTSRGIQRRFIRISSKRDYINIYKEYWLLNINIRKDVPVSVQNKLVFLPIITTENPFKTSGNSLKTPGNPVKTSGNPFKTPGNPQSKVKESKVKKSKGKNGKESAIEPAVRVEPAVPVEIINEWNDYVDMRNKIRKAMTPKAKELALKTLFSLSGGDIETMKAILTQSVFNSWQGLFEVKGGMENGANRKSDTRGAAAQGFCCDVI